MENKNQKQPIQARDLYNLSFEEIDALQNSIEAENLSLIERSHKQGRINEEERDYLLEFYQDSMDIYREVYRSLYETFGQPENTCSFDPATGKVDTDNSGRPVNYGLKVVTPFVNTRLEYRDKNNNPIYVVVPKMKSAERSIEKLEKEYGKEYHHDMEKALQMFFSNDDREAFCERLQNIPKNSSKLHDILRLTITCKYFSGVERIKRKLSENTSSSFYIDGSETRDRFLQPLSKNEKKYYDIKMIVHQKINAVKELDVELQLKIDTLYQGDMQTHKIYENIRAIEARMAKGDSDDFEIRRQQAQIKILTDHIRRINESFIHQYNMIILDKARRIEDDGYRPLRVQPDNADGTYNKCRKFIADEYMVESFTPFNSEEAFSANDETNKLCYLRMIGKISNDFDPFAENASKSINYRFARLTPAEVERFNGINEIAFRYQSIISRKIQDRRRQEMPAPYISAFRSGKISR